MNTSLLIQLDCIIFLHQFLLIVNMKMKVIRVGNNNTPKEIIPKINKITLYLVFVLNKKDNNNQLKFFPHERNIQKIYLRIFLIPSL